MNANVFEDSSAYLGTNAIVITKNDGRNSSDLVDATNYCGRGIEVSGNVFTRVVGTCQTDTGLVRI